MSDRFGANVSSGAISDPVSRGEAGVCLGLPSVAAVAEAKPRYSVILYFDSEVVGGATAPEQITLRRPVFVRPTRHAEDLYARPGVSRIERPEAAALHHSPSPSGGTASKPSKSKPCVSGA